MVSEPWSNRQQHQLSYTSSNTLQSSGICKERTTSSLTRYPEPPTIDDVQLHEHQLYRHGCGPKKDFEIHVQTYCTTKTSLQLEDIHFKSQGVTLLCDVSTSHARSIVTAIWRQQVFVFIHGISHLSIHATRKLNPSNLVWNGRPIARRGSGGLANLLPPHVLVVHFWPPDNN